MSEKELYTRVMELTNIINADIEKARENGASEAELLRLSSDLWKKMDPDNLRQLYEDAYATGMKKDMKRLILILAGILIITAVWQFARF